jgi:putative transposase
LESFIDKQGVELGVRRQCELLGFNRSNVYYHHWPKDAESEDRPRQVIDKQFMDDPCGVIKMAHYLQRLGHAVGEKLARRLTRAMRCPMRNGLN